MAEVIAAIVKVLIGLGVIGALLAYVLVHIHAPDRQLKTMIRSIKILAIVAINATV